MGTDWHPYIEHLVDGTWEPKWKPIPHPDWWYEDLLEQKIETDAARIMFPKAQPETYGKLLTQYYDNLPWPEVLSEFTDRPGIKMLWREHSRPEYWRAANSKSGRTPGMSTVMTRKGNFRETLKSRNYRWFNLFLNSYRSNEVIQTHTDLPSDLSLAVRREFDENWEADAHNIGWIMVDGLIQQYSELNKSATVETSAKINWLRKNAKGCRLIFWFDN